MTVVYFDPEVPIAIQHAYRLGEAALCDPTDPAGRAPEARSVEVSPNSLHALVGFGIIERLAAVAADDWSAIPGGDSLIMPARLDDAVAILYEADRDTYGPVHELLVEKRDGVEYRLRRDRREYQRTLTRLTDLFNIARRAGYAIRVRF